MPKVTLCTLNIFCGASQNWPAYSWPPFMASTKKKKKDKPVHRNFLPSPFLFSYRISARVSFFYYRPPAPSSVFVLCEHPRQAFVHVSYVPFYRLISLDYDAVDGREWKMIFLLCSKVGWPKNWLIIPQMFFVWIWFLRY